jgi:putative Holliday junction resolvase
MSEAVTQKPANASPGRVAGVDYGTVRIGIALTDPGRSLASPLATWTRSGREADAARFRRLVAEQQVVRFVVGLPVHTNGAESQKSREARAFATWLLEITGVPVELFDERFTSADAEELLLAADLSRQQRRARRDKLAAQILLSAWLQHGSAKGDPAPLED